MPGVGKSAESIFTEIYSERRWGDFESRSGRGSDLPHTDRIRIELPKLLKELKVTSMLDIPCGDFCWLKEVDLGFLSYTGADIVNEIIVSNQTLYATDKRQFKRLDIRSDPLPRVDLILCRDLFRHLSFEDIRTSIMNVRKSASTYLLATSCATTTEHCDIQTGKDRSVNLLIPPFNLPRPLRTVDDSNVDNSSKRLLLFSVIDLPAERAWPAGKGSRPQAVIVHGSARMLPTKRTRS